MAQTASIEQLRLANWIRPGDCVSWSHATAEPLSLTQLLVEQRHELAPFRVFAGTNYSGTVMPAHADAMQFVGMGAVGRNRDFLKAGVMDVLPCHLSQVPWLIRSGALRIDVMLIQVSLSPGGQYSLGAVSSYLPVMIEHARTVIAEVNAQAPWTHGSYQVDPKRIDVLVHSDRPLVQLPARAPQALDEAIARHVTPLVPDGAVLQVGIGTLPGAVLRGLRGHRDLGIHSGVIGDEVLMELIETGVVTNATKPFDRGVSVTGSLFGTDRLYRYAHANPAVRVEPVEVTHDLGRISQFDAFVTINSALEVDLTGQINAESAGRNYLGTIGGQTDFVRAALASRQGRSMVVIASAGEKDAKSRIVAQIEGVTTTARADADVVATEWGVAQLRGKTIRQRVRAMIDIAHPDHREALERQAHEKVAGL